MEAELGLFVLLAGFYLRWYFFAQGQEGDKTVAMAMANPEKFVLKPQREGGGTQSLLQINVVQHFQNIF